MKKFKLLLVSILFLIALTSDAFAVVNGLVEWGDESISCKTIDYGDSLSYRVVSGSSTTSYLRKIILNEEVNGHFLKLDELYTKQESQFINEIRTITSKEYLKPGTYELELYLLDEDNSFVDSIQFTVNEIPPVNNPPNAIIDSPTSDQIIPVGGQIDFQGHGEDSDGTIIAYSWNFGDGRTSTKQNPGKIQFNTSGTYTVTFNVQDNDNDWDLTPATVSIKVNEILDPIADFTVDPLVGTVETVFEFNADKSYDPNPWLPKWPECLRADLDENNTINILDLVQLLEILSTGGDKGDVNGDNSVNIFDLLTLLKMLNNDICSINPPPLKYYWDFGEGEGYTSYNLSEKTTYQYSTTGKKTVKLMVENSGLKTDITSIDITVKTLIPLNKPPTAKIDTPVSQTISIGESLTFTASDSDPDGTIVKRKWTFGNSGIPVSYVQDPGKKIFNKEGNFKMTYTVWDNDEATASDSVTINVISQPPEECPNPTYPNDKWDRVWCEYDTGFKEKISDTPDETNVKFNNDWGRGIVAGIQEDNIGFKSGRLIYFTETREYEFTVGSDDGLRIWIDSKEITGLDLWSIHDYRTKTFVKTLSAGYHKFRIDFYENRGHAHVSFDYRLPSPPNNPPTADDDTVKVNEDSTNNKINVLSNDNDPDGDTLTIISVTKPSHGKSSTDGNYVYYTPNGNYYGDDLFTYKISDNKGGTDTAKVYIKVKNINDPPKLDSIGNKFVNENQLVTFLVTASDPDNDPLTFSTSKLLEGAKFQNQRFSWTPTFGQSGVYQIMFYVYDNKGAEDSELVKITVGGINRAPKITSSPPTVFVTDSNFKREYRYDVDAYDPDNDPLTYSLITAPVSMTTDPNTGLIKWVPNKTQLGLNNVVVKVSDGTYSVIQSFTIRVITTKKEEKIEELSAREKIFISKLQIINDELEPGEAMLTNIVFLNKDENDMDARVTVSIPELAIKKRSKFDLKSNKQASRIIPLEIPNTADPGEYFVRITIYDGDISRTKYRFVNII